jgi:thioredoxin 2
MPGRSGSVSAYNVTMATGTLDDRGIIVPCAHCGRQNRFKYEHLGHAVRCAACKTPLAAPADPIEVDSSAHFDALVAHSSLPVVVDYWAPWCGPCRMVAPEIQKLAARQAGRWLVVKVNTEALSDLGERFGIRSIPTLAVFGEGRELARTSGARPASEIEKFVESATQALHH